MTNLGPKCSALDEERKVIQFDPRLESYKNFYDTEWGNQFLDAVEHTTLRQAGFDLVHEWQSIGFASQMPWALMQSMKGAVSAFAQDHPSDGEILCDLLAARIAQDADLSGGTTRRIQAVAKQLSEKIQAAKKQALLTIDLQSTWNQFLSLNQFSSSLWSSQRMCYSGICHAYENFLQQCVAAAKKQSDYAPRNSKRMKEDFEAEYGKEMTQDLFDGNINVARTVRNDIAHNGGRPSAKLQKMSHGILTFDGSLHIFPKDVKGLFSLVKDRVNKMAEYAKDNPKFAA